MAVSNILTSYRFISCVSFQEIIVFFSLIYNFNSNTNIIPNFLKNAAEL